MLSGPGSFIISFANNPREDFGAFAKGCTLAAIQLARILLEAPGFADYEACPMVFLYRHALNFFQASNR